jgi:large subunit ribosomal protein L32e
MEIKKPRFLRKDSHKMSKLGKRRKNKQKWKKPTGRDNKMREKRKGYGAVVSLGYRTDKDIRGMVKEKQPVQVENIKQLEKLKENEIAILGRVGQKKKIEIAKKAKELNIEIANLNVKKFLKEVENKKLKKKDDKKTESKKTETKTEEKKSESKEKEESKNKDSKTGEKSQEDTLKGTSKK